jgi:hypothetical protein
MADLENNQTLSTRLGNIPLVTDQKSAPCGAAFVLISPASADSILTLETAEIELRRGQRDVVVRFRGAEAATETFQSGHQLAQKGLDLASILGRLDTIIQDAEDEHILWWTGPKGLVVRLVSTTILRFGVGPVTVEVRDSSGNIVPPPPIHPRHHIGFRYYRLAQATDDLYDAYRNMYLAFEVLLSCRFPKEKQEQEIAWLKRGLKAASASLLLNDLVPKDALDPVEAVLETIYSDARLPLFHAKEGRDFYAPQDSPSNRKIVSKALNILTKIVLRMAEAWFDARRVGGAVMFGWVYESVASQLEKAKILISDDVSPFDPAEANLDHPRFRNAPSISTRLVPELQRGSEPAVFGHISNDEFSTLSVLRRIDLVTAAHPYISQMLESELTLDGIARLEVLMHMRAMNLNQPKSLFRQ